MKTLYIEGHNPRFGHIVSLELVDAPPGSSLPMASEEGPHDR